MTERQELEAWLIERGWMNDSAEASPFRWYLPRTTAYYPFETALARQLRNDAPELIAAWRAQHDAGDVHGDGTE